MSRLWPSGTSARAVMPSTTFSSTRTTPSFGPGRRPSARPRPSGTFRPRRRAAHRASHLHRAPARARRTRPASSGRGAPFRACVRQRQPRDRGAEQDRGATGSSGWPFKVSRISTPPRLCPTKCAARPSSASRAKRAKRATLPLERAAAPVGEDVRSVARARQRARQGASSRRPASTIPGASTTSRATTPSPSAQRWRWRARCARRPRRGSNRQRRAARRCAECGPRTRSSLRSFAEPA
jgi:hypothetical protein